MRFSTVIALVVVIGVAAAVSDRDSMSNRRDSSSQDQQAIRSKRRGAAGDQAEGFGVDDLIGKWISVAETRDLKQFAKGCQCTDVEFSRGDDDRINMNLSCRNATKGGMAQTANSTLIPIENQPGQFKLEISAKKTPAIPAKAVKGSKDESDKDTKDKSAASSSDGVEKKEKRASSSDAEKPTISDDADLVLLTCSQSKRACLWYLPKVSGGDKDKKDSDSDDKKLKGAAFVLSKDGSLSDEELSGLNRGLKDNLPDVGKLVRGKCAASGDNVNKRDDASSGLPLQDKVVQKLGAGKQVAFGPAMKPQPVGPQIMQAAPPPPTVDPCNGKSGCFTCTTAAVPGGCTYCESTGICSAVTTQNCPPGDLRTAQQQCALAIPPAQCSLFNNCPICSMKSGCAWCGAQGVCKAIDSNSNVLLGQGLCGDMRVTPNMC